MFKTHILIFCKIILNLFPSSQSRCSLHRWLLSTFFSFQSNFLLNANKSFANINTGIWSWLLMETQTQTILPFDGSKVYLNKITYPFEIPEQNEKSFITFSQLLQSVFSLKFHICSQIAERQLLHRARFPYFLYLGSKVCLQTFSWSISSLSSLPLGSS